MRQAKWQVAADTWSSTKAKALLSSEPPGPLPSRGPLHKLLVTTKRALPTPRSLSAQDAQDAVDAGAVLVLAKLANWLQQRPCHELLGVPTNSASSSLDWAYILDTLLAICEQEPRTEPAQSTWREAGYAQMNASGEPAIGTCLLTF